MKTADQYDKWVEWSDEDRVYIGKCPDLITGIHGNDPGEVFRDLCETIEEVITHFEQMGKTLPPLKDSSDDGSRLKMPNIPRSQSANTTDSAHR
ncbi:hypothetical protein N8766_01700 [bacterium]|nr:hypothetical protein [bacterium]